MIDDAAGKIEELFNGGRACLLSGKPYESLRFYAKAIQISLNAQVIETALNSIDLNTLDRVQQLENKLVRKLLLIGIATKFPSTDEGKAALVQIKKLATTSRKSIAGPVVVVAGGCSVEVETQMRRYRSLILEAFRDFEGTIISGGTTSGISGLIGQAQQKFADKMRAVGYIPKSKTDLLDKRYGEIRFTDGKEFSPIEPLQCWIDIIASGIKPSGAKLLGINGGRISALEYRIALALGAQVAIVVGSGMEADKLLLDNDWNNSKNLVSMPNDAETLWAFIQAKAKDSHKSEV